MTTRTRTTRRATGRPSRTGARTRRSRRGGYRLAFADRFMLAGSSGGAVYLITVQLAYLPTTTATVTGVLVFGFVLGVLVTVRRLRRLRTVLGRRARR